MKKLLLLCSVLSLSVLLPGDAIAQLKIGGKKLNTAKLLDAGKDVAKAVTLSDSDIAQLSREAVAWMDANNPVADETTEYGARLKRLTEGITEVDGLPLNFKVYKVADVNAFACGDGSIRVFSALMDLMDDDELMAIIGHEIGHVILRHSKNGFKEELLTGALKDAVASTGNRAAALTDSQLGTLGSALIGAKYSQKQEREADNCGYDFLVAKGKNPWGMVMSFEKFLNMEQQSNQKTSYVQRMFSSHPETESRIKAMTERCQKDGFTRPAAASK